MSARRVTSLLLAVAQATTGVYLIVYLYRWQWNRALICGVLFVATEVLLVGRLVLQRIRALDDRVSEALAEDRVRARLVEARPAPTDRFAWLRESAGRTNVFLPLLLGAGVLASGLAWAVEAVARRTAQPALERSLSSTLGTLAFPAGGFVGPAPATVAPPAHPWLRRAGVALAAVAVTVGVGAAIDVMADATQTRPDRLEAGATTVVDLRFRGERAVADPERHASHLVEFCTAPFRREVATLAIIGRGDTDARVVLDADLGEHGTTRLRGCLEDTSIERVQASVVGISRVPPG